MGHFLQQCLQHRKRYVSISHGYHYYGLWKFTLAGPEKSRKSADPSILSAPHPTSYSNNAVGIERSFHKVKPHSSVKTHAKSTKLTNLRSRRQFKGIKRDFRIHIKEYKSKGKLWLKTMFFFTENVLILLFLLEAKIGWLFQWDKLIFDQI